MQPTVMEQRQRKARAGNAAVAVAYLRVSTDAQELGPDAQRAAIERYAKAHGIAIAAWCTDVGVSGASELAERRGLIEALAALREHRAGALLVLRRDRLARDVGVAAGIDRAVERCGARVVCCDGHGNGDDPSGRFMRTLLDAVAEFERAMISARTSAALGVKRARGEFTGGEPPFGFTIDAAGHLIPHADEQRVIAAVCEFRLAGLSLRQIAGELARAGVLGRSGKPLQLTQIARIHRARRVAA